jgi:hypothetical protein
MLHVHEVLSLTDKMLISKYIDKTQYDLLTNYPSGSAEVDALTICFYLFIYICIYTYNTYV